VLVLGAILSVQLGAAFAKRLFADLGVDGTVLVRMASGALLLAVSVRPRRLRLPAGQLWLVATFAVTLAAMNLCFYASIDRIPLAVAVTVEFVGPLGVAVAGSRRPLHLLWVVLAATGVVLLTGGLAGGLDPAGVLLAFAAGCCWAGYILLSQRVGRAVPGATGLVVAMLAAAVLLLPVGVAGAGARLLEPRLLAAGAAVGLLASAIPYALELEALRRLPARTFGVLMSLEPAVAALAGLVVLGQTLRPRELAGIALVVMASAGATRASAPRGRVRRRRGGARPGRWRSTRRTGP
jgi:inner membrane transporter RhtA